MRYILIYKARRKNAKRHIWGRYSTIEACKREATNKNYDFSIYNHKWELIEDLKEAKDE